MDFTLDTLASGRRFRTSNLVDDFTRECLTIEVDTSLGGARVVRVLERLLLAHAGRYGGRRPACRKIWGRERVLPI
jgi:transposase InsO family protein